MPVIMPCDVVRIADPVATQDRGTDLARDVDPASRLADALDALDDAALLVLVVLQVDAQRPLRVVLDASERA